MEIPSDLRDRIRDGDVILFLGSGASYGALRQGNSQGTNDAPLGNQLAELLSKKFIEDEVYRGESLTYISQNVQATASIEEVQKFIADYLSSLRIAEYQKFRLLLKT